MLLLILPSAAALIVGLRYWIRPAPFTMDTGQRILNSQVAYGLILVVIATAISTTIGIGLLFLDQRTAWK